MLTPSHRALSSSQLRFSARAGLLLGALALAAGACGGLIAPTDAPASVDAGDVDARVLDSGRLGVKPWVVGAACTDDSACPGHIGLPGVLGQGPYCAKSDRGAALPNGYCTSKCTEPEECAGAPRLALCGVPTEFGAPADPLVAATCVQLCNPNDSAACRSGYTCRDLRAVGAVAAAPRFGCWIK